MDRESTTMQRPVAAAPLGRPDRILVLGVARSGTTWLAAALGKTEGARVINEPDNVDADPARDAGGRLGFGPYPILDRGQRAPQFRALWDLSFAARVPRNGWQLKVGRLVLRLPRRLRDPFLRRSAQAVSALPGRAPHVVVKSIYAMLAVDWIAANYQPRIIVIQRNPLNVISSWAELGVHGFDLLARPRIADRYLHRLGVVPPGPDASQLQRIAAWVGVLTTVLNEELERHPDWLLVTHEYLCADPETRIREVCEWAGLTWTPDAASFLAESNRPGEGFSSVRITRDQPDRWRRRLSDEQVVEIEEVLAQFPSRGWVHQPSPSGDHRG
jgi:hypothetical protein